MLKPKNIAIPAILGFILSFLISLISIHKFSISLLRGIIFAVVFAVISAMVEVLYGKFLSDETDFETKGFERKRGDRTGSVVDITVSDEGLKEDSDGPQFFVAGNKHKLSENEIGKTEEPKEKLSSVDMNKPVEEVKRSEVKEEDVPKQNTEKFKPVSLGEQNQFVSVEEVQKKSSPAPKSTPSSEAVKNFDEIDGIENLPDLSNFDSSGKLNPDGRDLIKDSEFAVAGQKKKVADFLEGNGGQNSNAATMAQAIRTLLNGD